MTAVSSLGTLLKIGDGADPEVFTTIGAVKDISGPSIKMGTTDASTHASLAKEWVASIVDNGEVSFDINFDYSDTTHAGLMTDLNAGTLRNFEIILTDSGATQVDFTAIVTGYELSAPVEGILTASISLQISGPITIA